MGTLESCNWNLGMNRSVLFYFELNSVSYEVIENGIEVSFNSDLRLSATAYIVWEPWSSCFMLKLYWTLLYFSMDSVVLHDLLLLQVEL